VWAAANGASLTGDGGSRLLAAAPKRGGTATLTAGANEVMVAGQQGQVTFNITTNFQGLIAGLQAGDVIHILDLQTYDVSPQGSTPVMERAWEGEYAVALSGDLALGYFDIAYDDWSGMYLKLVAPAPQPGTEGDDTVNGSSGSETLNGGAGNDAIFGGAEWEINDGNGCLVRTELFAGRFAREAVVALPAFGVRVASVAAARNNGHGRQEGGEGADGGGLGGPAMAENEHPTNGRVNGREEDRTLHFFLPDNRREGECERHYGLRGEGVRDIVQKRNLCRNPLTLHLYWLLDTFDAYPYSG